MSTATGSICKHVVVSKGKEYTYWQATLRPESGAPVRKTFPMTVKGLVKAQDWLGACVTAMEAEKDATELETSFTEDTELQPLESLPEGRPDAPRPSLWEVLGRLVAAGRYSEARQLCLLASRQLLRLSDYQQCD